MNVNFYKRTIYFLILCLSFCSRPLFAVDANVSSQDPQKPYPYQVEEVSYVAGEGVTLAGTLTLPKGNGPFPAVLLIAGSGPEDRDETFGSHHPLLVHADALTRKGFAALRYDKRGVGGSTGDGRNATYEDFMNDAIAGVKYLQSRKDINPKKIGLLGTSEGGLLAYRMAARSNAIDFIALLGAPCLEGEKSIFLQHQLAWKANGMSDRAVSIQVNMEKDCIDEVKGEKDDTAALEKIRKIVSAYETRMTADDRKELKNTLDTVDAWGKALTSPYWRYSLAYNPRNDLQKVKCPVLAVWGEKDLMAPPQENLKALETDLGEGHNGNLTVKIFPGLNHPLQHCKTGATSEFFTIPETISPEALEFISNWIEKQAK